MASGGASLMGLTEISQQGFVTDGLSAFYHMGNYDGEGNYITNDPLPNTITDLTGNGYDLALYNFAGTSDSGANGNNTEENPSYLKSDGVDDYAGTTDPTGITSETFSCQIVFSQEYDGSSYKRVFAKGGYMTGHGGPTIVRYGSSATRFMCQLFPAGWSENTAIYIDVPENETTCVSLTYDSSTSLFSVYKNGVFIDSATTDPLERYDFNICLYAQFGNDGVTATSPGNYKIYNFAYYDNKVLSAAEIEQNYNAGLVWQIQSSLKNIYVGGQAISKIYLGTTEVNKIFLGNIEVYSVTNSGDDTNSVADWTPAEISTTLWLDANDSSTLTLDESNVTQWGDKSGNERNATQGTSSYQPVYDSIDKSVNLNEDYLHLPNVPTQAGFFVVRNANGNNDTDSFSPLICSEYTSGSHHIILYGENYTISVNGTSVNDTGDASINGNSLTPGNGYGVDISISNYVPFPSRNEPDLTYFQWKKEYSSIDYLGRLEVNTVDYYSKIDFHEVILLQNTPTEETRQKIEGYLAHKWGFADKLPAEHPYKNNKPTV